MQIRCILNLFIAQTYLFYQINSFFLIPSLLYKIQHLPSNSDNANNFIDDENIINVITIKQEVETILDSFVIYDKDSGNFHSKIDPSILIENAHILVKGNIYEEVINDRMNSELQSSSSYTSEIIKIDSTVRNFVIGERKSRARLKFNYIVAGATSNRLEEAITVLSDRFLINYILNFYSTFK